MKDPVLSKPISKDTQKMVGALRRRLVAALGVSELTSWEELLAITRDNANRLREVRFSLGRKL